MAGRRVVAGLVVAVGALGVLPGSAGAAVATGGGADPAGDGAGGARDLLAVAASYDDAGAIGFRLTLAAAPADATAAQAIAMVGTRQPGGGCLPAGAVGGLTSHGPGVWTVLDGGAGGTDGAWSLDGATVAFSASAPELALGPRDCALVTLSAPPGQPRATYDEAGPFALAPPPPQPDPQPQPQPGPQPQPQPGSTARPSGRARTRRPARRARLAATVAGAGRALPRGRWSRLTVRVRDAGTAPTRRVALRIAVGRGVALRPARQAIGTLEPGRTASRTIAVKPGARAKAATTLTVRASAGRLAARATATLRLAGGGAPKPAPKPRPRPTRPGAPGADDLAGRYFWRFTPHTDWAWDNTGVAFLAGGWAYRGLPKGGLPRCTAVTASGEGDGCLRYSLDAKSGALTFGDERGTWKDGKLTIGDQSDWRPLQLPAAGSRYDVELVNRGFRGYCGLIGGCTTWQEWLTLRGDGQFALSSMTTSTMGGSGTPFTAGWNAPPDQHGTYEVLARGAIRLSYADGTVVVKTIGIEYRDGRPDPGGEGLLLDDTNFYGDDD